MSDGTEPLAWLTAARAAALVAAREVSPVELVRAYLARIAALDGTLRAFITVCADEALRAAGAAEEAVARGERPGPLHGAVLAVKDQFHTRGIRTTAGSRVLERFVPDADATVVARLRAAGAILLGKLNLSEFALGGTITHPFGQPRNPWNPEREPGGSSSGSGVAAAAALCSATLGEDTGGSIRGPAAYCGVVGLRPTWGRVSRAGCVPVSWSMDAPGPIARSVEDAALLLEVIAGPDPADAWTSARPVPRYRDALTGQVRGLVIGVVRELLDSPDTDPEVRDAVAAAARALERLGARVEPVSLPLVPRAGAVFMALADSDGAALHQGWLRDRAGEYDVGTRRRLLAASLIPAAILQEAQRARVLIRVQVLAALDRHDLLLAPAQPTPAPSIALAAAPITSGRAAAQRFFNRRSYSTPASLAGVPALSVPCGMSASGLPIGLQLIGRRYDEATVLRAAHAFEADSGWATRRPPLPRSA